LGPYVNYPLWVKILATSKRLWSAYPLGRGKRLFGETSKPVALRLVRSKVSTSGVVMSTYVPDGDIRPGSFASVESSEKELNKTAARWAE
jgi:hypothetical protein